MNYLKESQKYRDTLYSICPKVTDAQRIQADNMISRALKAHLMARECPKKAQDYFMGVAA